MTASVSRIVCVLLVFGAVTACASSSSQTWYEDRCVRAGFNKGTSDFDLCIARDKKWVEETQRRTTTMARP